MVIIFAECTIVGNLYEVSLLFKKRLVRSTEVVVGSKSWLRKVCRSLRPIKLELGSPFFFIDKGLIFTSMEKVLDLVVDLLCID